MFRILAENKSFRSLWLGQLISAFGDRLSQMGILSFVMLASGDKGNIMAIITFFTLLPFSLFGPLFGALADRYSRKKIMIAADCLRAVLVLFIPFIWVNTHSTVLIIIWFFILGSLAALFTPAKMSIITNITDKDILLKANSVVVTTGMVATLVGTLIAGAVIKLTGVRYAFFINSLTYLISALFILRIVYNRPVPAPVLSKSLYETLIDDIRQGLVYMRRHSLILSLVILSSIFAFISSFAYILILNYGSLVLGQGPFGMGALLSSAGFGMIFGSLILFKRKDKVNYKRALYLSYSIVGNFAVSFYFRPPFYLTVFILFCAGIGAAVLTISLDTIFQRITPDGLKGKVFAARGMLTNAVFLLSLILIGILIKYVAADILFAAIGIAALFTALRVFLYEKRWGYQLLRLALRLLMKLLFNLKVSGIENLPKSKKVILAGNHTSLIDGAVLMCAYPQRVYFLVAESLFKIKFWGWCARRLNYIQVKRGGFNKEAVKQAVRLLKSGYSVGIFPEGKITIDDKLTEGRAGMAVIARIADADIIPFAIEGAYEAWPLPKKLPRRFPVEVRFGRPIDIKDYPLQEELVEEVMEDISELKLYMEREGYLRADPDEIIKHLINIG